MSWTKRELILQAYDELGFADYAYDLQPEELQSALSRLDSMIASWNARGIRLGYPLYSSPQASSIDEDTQLPDRAFEAVYLNLAMRLAPSLGKSVQVETRIAAREAYKAMLQHYVQPNQMQFPDTLPKGQGNKSWRYNDPFIAPPEDPVDAGPDGIIEFY